MMRAFIEDHTLIIKAADHRAFLIRPCNSIDGTFKRGGKILPWFRVSRHQDGAFRWTYFAMPFLLLGMVDDPSHKEETKA